MKYGIKIYFLLAFFFTGFSLFSQENKPFEQNKKWGFKNATGKVVVKPIYDTEPDKIEHLWDKDGFDTKWRVTQNNKQGLLDNKLNTIIPLEYVFVGDISSSACDCSEGIFYVKNNQGKALYSLNLKKPVTAFEYEKFDQVRIGKPWIVAYKNTADGQARKSGVLDRYTGLPMIAVENDAVYASSSYNGGDNYIFQEKYFRFIKQEKEGLYDTTGNLVLSFVYDNISFTGKHIILKKDKTFMLANENGKILTQEYAGIKLVWYEQKEHYIVRLQDKYGMLNNELKNIVPIVYDSIYFDSYNPWVRAQRHNQWDVYDLKGTRFDVDISNLKHNMVTDGKNVLYAFLQDEKWGIMSGNGKIIYPPVYTNCDEVAQDLGNFTRISRFLQLEKDGKYELVDMTGKTIATGLNMRVSTSGKFPEVLRWVETKKGTKEETALFTWEGKVVIPFTKGGFYIAERYPGYIIQGKFVKMLEDKHGEHVLHEYMLYDTTGRPLISKTYSFLYAPADGLICVNTGGTGNCLNTVNGGKWGYINLASEEVIPLKYTYARNFNNGVAAVYEGGKFSDGAEGGKWTLINQKGEKILPASVDIEPSFSTKQNNYTYLSLLENPETGEMIYGLYSSSGKEILPAKFSRIEEFVNGMSIVTTVSGKNGIINDEGKWIADTLYASISRITPYKEYYDETFYVLEQDGKYGLVDNKQQKVLDMEYTYMAGFRGRDSIIQLGVNNKVGLYSLAAKKWIIQPMYDKISDGGPTYIGMVNNGCSGVIDYNNKVIVTPKDTFDFYHGTFTAPIIWRRL